MTADERAAAEEAINEAGLEAERVYDFLTHAPEEDALDYLRLTLKGFMAMKLAYEEIRRVATAQREAVELALSEPTDDKNQGARHGLH